MCVLFLTGSSPFPQEKQDYSVCGIPSVQQKDSHDGRVDQRSH